MTEGGQGLARQLATGISAQEALGWYQGLREDATADLVFLGPALLREAAIYRQAGRIAQADALNARFTDLWGSADRGFLEAVLDKYGQ